MPATLPSLNGHRRALTDVLGVALAIALSITLPACGSDDPAPSGGKGGGAEGSGLSQKLPGPCATTLTTSTDKVYANFIDYTYDDAGRLTADKSGQGATELGADIYAKAWTYDTKGQVTGESLVTYAKGGDSYDYTYTHDANGRLATRKGTNKSWGKVDCTYEYLEPKKDYNIHCTYEREGKGGKKPKTGKYLVEVIHGDKQVTLLTTANDSSKPKQEVRRFDDAGNLIAIELDPSLRGYPSHITGFQWDAKGNRVQKTIDSDADGTPELTWDYSFDSHGNELGAVHTVAGVGVDHELTHDYGCW